MKRKLLKDLMFMLCIALSVIVISGCSGGGSGSGAPPEKTVALAYDADQDGTPDIFDDYPEDAASSAYSVCNEADHPAPHDSMETAIGKDAPYPAQTTFKGTIDPANSPDYFAVALEAGRTYSLVFHDPQNMDGSAVAFAPDVNVHTGSFGFLVGLPEDEEPIQAVSNVISSSETLPLESSSTDDSRVIVLSFTPQESRIHYVAIRSSETVAPGGHPYLFDLINDEDRDGMTTHYTPTGNDGYSYTHDDIILLKSSMKPYVSEWASDGSPKTFGAGAQTAFASTVAYLGAARTESACSDKTTLSPFVSDIPWNSDYKFGYGIDAATGLPSNQLQAVNSFTPPVPVNASTSTDTTIYFVNSDEQYAREVKAGFNTTFSSFGVTFKAAGSYAENIKYSEKETTLILKYYVKETEYRLSDPAGGAYTLTDSAKAYLSANKDDFRNQYGDYFIAGARYGAQYVATLHITASSAEEKREIETKLSQASQTYKVDATEEFKLTFSKVTKNSTVEVKRTTIGGNETVLSAGTTPDQMFDDLKAFIQSCTKDNRAPLEAYMFRFNQMPDGAAIANEINVNSCVFSASRDLSKDYLALTARAKVIAGLDANTFQAGVQNDYAQEYDALINEINDNRQSIFRDVNKIDTYGGRVKAALNKFTDLVDRQSFFMKLVQLQKSWPYHTEHKARESGFRSYTPSRTVNNDIMADTYSVEHHEGWHIGWRNWYPNWAPGSNSIVCYIKIDVDSSTKNDDCWDGNYPSLGRDHLSFHFKSGYDRKGSWWLKAKGVNLGAGGKSATGNYPFNWELML